MRKPNAHKTHVITEPAIVRNLVRAVNQHAALEVAAAKAGAAVDQLSEDARREALTNANGTGIKTIGLIVHVDVGAQTLTFEIDSPLNNAEDE